MKTILAHNELLQQLNHLKAQGFDYVVGAPETVFIAFETIGYDALEAITESEYRQRKYEEWQDMCEWDEEVAEMNDFDAWLEDEEMDDDCYVSIDFLLNADEWGWN